MLWLEILLLVGIIAYSAKLGGIGVGMAGAVGMIAATAVFGLKPGFIPVDVMLIIMTVILAISVMQRAGGLAFMVKCAEKLLRNNPKYINALAPAVCFMLTTAVGLQWWWRFAFFFVICRSAAGRSADLGFRARLH